MFVRVEDTITVKDVDDDELEVSSGLDVASGKQWILFEEHAPHGVLVNGEEAEKFVRELVDLVGLNREQDFLVARSTPKEPTEYKPHTAPLITPVHVPQDQSRLLIKAGDIFQSKGEGTSFARVVEVSGNMIIYVTTAHLFEEKPEPTDLVRTPFGTFVKVYQMWRPTTSTYVAPAAPLPPGTLAASEMVSEKVGVRVHKPETEQVNSEYVKNGDRLWLDGAKHEVAKNEAIFVNKTMLQRITFHDGYGPVIRTTSAWLEKVV